jgi:hypothetical protein
MMEFSPKDLQLKDMHIYTADLHAANEDGQLQYGLEYSFNEAFGLDSPSPAAMASLVERMSADPASPEWQRYRGDMNGTFYCKGWLANKPDACPHPAPKCVQHCQGECKSSWLKVLNGSSMNEPANLKWRDGD